MLPEKNNKRQNDFVSVFDSLMKEWAFNQLINEQV